MKDLRRIRVPGIDRPMPALALGTASYQPASEDVCFGLLDSYVEQGGMLIDTARGYGDSEEVIGRWLRTRRVRGQVILATKGGHGDCHGLARADFARTIEDELSKSLKTLGVDHVDLYLLHRDSPTVPVAEIMDVLNVEFRRGRVRALGASNWEYQRIAAANDYARREGLQGFAAVSNNLSLAAPSGPFYPGLVSVDSAGERWHVDTGVPLIPWSAQARGFFTGRYTPDVLANSDAVQDGFQRRMLEVYCTDANFERLRRATELGRSKGGYSAVEVALAWLLEKPFPIVPIVGPRSVAELSSCMRAGALKLGPDEVQWLDLRRDECPRA